MVSTKKNIGRKRRFKLTGALYDENGRVKGFYTNQINNYKQDHYQLPFSHWFNLH
ncbi:MAG: hypothetical protein ACMUEM_07725 [Flavobacteriales bacterium AspAUS03]